MRLIAAAATALTLLLSFPAAAARPMKTAPAKAAPAREPTVAPAATSGTVYAAESGFDLQNASVSGFIGGEFGDLDGFYLRADGTIPIVPLSPSIDLIAVGQLGFTHLGMDVPYGSVAWNMVKVTAAARAQMALSPELDAFADAGLGFYFGSGKTELNPPFPLPSSSASSSSGGFQARLAVGGFYHLQPQIDLAAELGLNPYFGDAETTNFFIGAGVQLKL